MNQIGENELRNLAQNCREISNRLENLQLWEMLSILYKQLKILLKSLIIYVMT